MSIHNSEKKRNKRQRIIDAAIQKFAERGYRDTPVSEIAKLANVADGTIYNYFDGKEHLLLCIFEEKMQEIIDELETRLQTVDGSIERIRVFIEHHFWQLEKNPSLAQVFQVELRQSQRFYRGYHPQKLFDYLAILGDTIREGQQRGELNPVVHAQTLQWSIFGALDEISIQWVLASSWQRRNERRDSSFENQNRQDFWGFDSETLAQPSLLAAKVYQVFLMGMMVS